MHVQNTIIFAYLSLAEIAWGAIITFAKRLVHNNNTGNKANQIFARTDIDRERWKDIIWVHGSSDMHTTHSKAKSQ